MLVPPKLVEFENDLSNIKEIIELSESYGSKFVIS
jgi:hypothetical protein